MKHLITGVAGFIGSNLARELINRGEEVIGIDCFTDYYSRALKESNINDLLEKRNFNFIEGDLLTLDLKNIFKDVDYIYHQAAQAGVRSSWGKDFEIYSRNNILLTQRLLEAAVDSNIKKFVYASSSSVYGDVDELPMKEKHKLQPVSPYGVSKLAAENMCYLYWKNYGVPTISLRYFTVYGEGQRPDMAFHIFIKNVLQNKTIHVFGNGKQSRNFTYVGDVVRANILSAKSEISGEVLNIGGNQQDLTINYIIESISNILGKKCEVKYEPVVKGDVKHTAADCIKAKELLDYQPQISLKEGLKKQIKWMKNLYQEEQ